MQIDAGKTNFELIFEGPANEEENTLRSIRAALVGELGLTVDEAQELFANSPSRIRIAESKADLERDLSVLLKAGSKARILLVAPPAFQFVLEEDYAHESAPTQAEAVHSPQAPIAASAPSEDFGLTLDLESDAGLPLLEPGLQFVEDVEDIPSPLASQSMEKPKGATSTATAHSAPSFSLEAEEEENITPEMPINTEKMVSHSVQAHSLSSMSIDEELEAEKEVAPTLDAQAGNRTQGESSSQETEGQTKKPVEQDRDIPLANLQKTERARSEERRDEPLAEDRDGESQDESSEHVPTFFETRMGVSLLIVFAAGLFIFGNFLFLASQKTDATASFDPKLLSAISEKNLPPKLQKSSTKQKSKPEYVLQTLGASTQQEDWRALWEVSMNGPHPVSVSWELEQAESVELTKEEIVKGARRKPWIHKLELPKMLLSKKEGLWAGEEQAKVYIADEDKRYRRIVPARVTLRKQGAESWIVEFSLGTPTQGLSADELLVSRIGDGEDLHIALQTQWQFDAPTPVLAKKGKSTEQRKAMHKMDTE